MQLSNRTPLTRITETIADISHNPHPLRLGLELRSR